MTLDRVRCYIEEYNNESGELCERLKDKESDKKILIEGNFSNNQSIEDLMKIAKKYRYLMPGIYKRKGIDSIEIIGEKIAENIDFIHININNPNSYCSFQYS